MSNDQSSTNRVKPQYDLEERTAKFGEAIIDFCKRIPKSSVNSPITSQLIRAGTSIGANYCEADEASSKKDFINKITIAKKETKETKYWLRMIAHAVPDFQTEARPLWREAQEFNLIFAAIVRNTKKSLGV